MDNFFIPRWVSCLEGNWYIERVYMDILTFSRNPLSQLLVRFYWHKWRVVFHFFYQYSICLKTFIIHSWRISFVQLHIRCCHFVCMHVYVILISLIEEKRGADNPKLYLLIAEGICTVWFSCEFILRLAFCPHLKPFFTNYQNWIDLISIVPAYFIILDASNFTVNVLTTFRILRIFRFLKLLYDLQIIGKTFKASSNLFLVLLFVLLIPVLVCSSVLFYTEGNHGDSFSKPKYTSIPASLWWGIVTVTTVGYGDLSPTTLPGKIFGVFCALCGVLLVAMSASIAGSSFVLYYNLARAQMKLPKKRRNIDIDVESLPTIINFKNVPSLSSTPEDSGCSDRSSAHSDDACMRKCFGFGKDDTDSRYGKDNGIFTVVRATPDKQLYEEGYLDLVKKTILLERQTPL